MHRPDSFRRELAYRIREIPHRRRGEDLRFYPQVPITWEYSSYQGAPKNWMDPYIVRQKRLKEEEAARKRLDEQIDELT